jgi:hypothetical protein
MPELLTIEDLAKFLKLTKRSAYELTKARTRARQIHPVPMIRINSHPRFVRAEVEKWILKLQEEAAV